MRDKCCKSSMKEFQLARTEPGTIESHPRPFTFHNSWNKTLTLTMTGAIEGVATKKIKGKNHKNHKRSESSRKNQPVGEKNQNKNQLWISKENLPLVIIYIAFYMKLIWVPSLTSWSNERMKLPLVLICMGFDRKLIFDVTARRAIKKLLGFKES